MVAPIYVYYKLDNYYQSVICSSMHASKGWVGARSRRGRAGTDLERRIRLHSVRSPHEPPPLRQVAIGPAAALRGGTGSDQFVRARFCNELYGPSEPRATYPCGQKPNPRGVRSAGANALCAVSLLCWWLAGLESAPLVRASLMPRTSRACQHRTCRSSRSTRVA